MKEFLELSLHCGLFIAVIAGLRAVLKRSLPRTAFVTLWLAAVVRLLCPVAVRCPVSIWNLAADPVKAVRAAPVLPKAVPGAVAVRGPDWLFLGWAMVAAVLLMGIAVVYFAGTQKCRTMQWLGGNVYRCGAVDSPCVQGIFRPRILIPEGMDDAALPYVLLHERVHARRMDNLWKLLALIAAAVHWFNPMAWLLVVLLDRDLEVSCDAWAVRKLDAGQRRCYALSLLELAERPRKRSPLASGFTQNPLEERIQSIMKHTKRSFAALGAAVIMVLSATAVFATEAPKDLDLGENLKSFFVWTEEDTQILTDGELSNVVTYTSTVSGEDMEPLTAEEYEAQIAESEAYLAQQVADGEMTQAEMDETLAVMRQTLEELKRGDAFMFKASLSDGELGEVVYVTVTGNPSDIGTLTDDNVVRYNVESDIRPAADAE